MLCIHERTKNILEADDFFLSECLACRLIFLQQKNEPNSDKNIYANYYKKETGERFGHGTEIVVKAFRFWRAWKVFCLKPKSKKILDIGSGRGWMLYFLKKYFKYDVAVGTQISENAYKFSKDKLGLEIYNKDLLDLELSSAKFNIITLWHVLEHVPTPEAYVQRIGELLENDGLVLIEVPNFNSWSRILSKKRWLALDPQHHKTFFTPDSLEAMLKKNNFKIKKINTFSLEYSTFTSAQSLLSLIARTNNYFFNWLQEENRIGCKIIFHALLFAILFPLCLIFNFSLYFSNKGEIINIIAQKNAK